MSRKSPITVQQWVDSLPVSTAASNNTITQAQPSRRPSAIRAVLARDLSLQSDDASSHCSSVESVLELRRPDPEAVLLGLGFGPPRSSDIISRIPKRFLQPSKLQGVDIDKFLREQEQLRSMDQQLNSSFFSNNSTPSSPNRNIQTPSRNNNLHSL